MPAATTSTSLSQISPDISNHPHHDDPSRILSRSIGGLSIQVNPNFSEQQSRQGLQCKSFRFIDIYTLTFINHAPLDAPMPLDFTPVPMPPPEPTETLPSGHTLFPFGAFDFGGDIEPEEEGLFGDNDDDDNETLCVPHMPDNLQTNTIHNTLSPFGITPEVFQSRLHTSPFIVSTYVIRIGT